MTLEDHFHKNIPEYYPYMYLDGYTPEQIMYAAHKKILRELAERKAKENEIDKIKIVSEVKIK